MLITDSFSLGLKKIIRDKVIEKSILNNFSVGLKELNNKKPITNTLIKSFALGINDEEIEPTDIRIYRRKF